MIDKVEVYVRSEEVVVGQTVIGRPIADHWCTAKDTLRTEKVSPEADRTALEVVNEVAKEKSVKVEVVDVSTLGGKLKAKRAGIKETPAIIISGNKIYGIPKREQILKLL
ncbi:MAG: hypothetical protein ACP5IM_00385 [Candidatus Bathyarchaeia archaeon]